MRILVFSVGWFLSAVTVAFCFGEKPRAVIYQSDDSYAEKLAAREVRRYFYLRTGRLLPLASWKEGISTGGTIVVGAKDRPWIGALLDDLQVKKDIAALKSEEYLIKTLKTKDGETLVIAGGDPIGTLYGAYRLAEALGMRFYLHGDVAPDDLLSAELPRVDLRGKPIFALRGIQPFHDFPEGPDWWNRDDFRAYLGQLPKMGMNFFGLHCYPEGGVGPEPLIWIGPGEEIGEGARVKAGYPARHFTTDSQPPAWGYSPLPTASFSFGAADLFDGDDYGADYMRGTHPWKEMSPEQCNALFERVGLLLGDAFQYAKRLGIKTCIGTETPLTIPTPVKKRLQAAGKEPADPAVVQEIYEGMFRRIMQTHPLDYYWLWTPEGWTWEKVEQRQIDATLGDLRAAVAAAKKVQTPFTLATCGWVLGPPQSPSLFDDFLPKVLPMSCISRTVGNTPVEPGFAKVSGRPKWAIPWMEDDPGMTMPQLWAGRMRRDAADARAYGCTGLMGIHWRTEILGPNVSALAKAAWDQRGWNPEFDRPVDPEHIKIPEGVEGGEIGRFPNNLIGGTEDSPLYQVVRYNLKAYHLDVPDGIYTVTLKFCEPHYQEKGKRIFSVKLQDHRVIDQLDIFEKAGGNKALDFTFRDLSVKDGRLTIEFIPIVEFPSIAAIVVEGKAAEGGKAVTRKINCGGPAYKDYAADLAPVGPASRPRGLPADDFYADWARTNFGPEAAAEIAAIFTRLDGRLPRPADWVTGPGSIRPDDRSWDTVAKDYGFVDELEALGDKVEGPGNRQRYEYWLNAFRLLRSIAKIRCDWDRYNAAIGQVKAEQDPQIQNRLARQSALPRRIALVRACAEMHRHLLNSINTPGEMGNLANWQTQTAPVVLTSPGEELARLLGEPLPPEAQPSKTYVGRPRLFVPTTRTSLQAGEPLHLKVVLLGGASQDATLYWRPLGRGEYRKVPLEHVARAVYRVALPADATRSDFEYYVRAAVGGESLCYPPTAPRINQTVVVVEE